MIRHHRRPLGDHQTTEALIIGAKIIASTLFVWGASILFLAALG